MQSSESRGVSSDDIFEEEEEEGQKDTEHEEEERKNIVHIEKVGISPTSLHSSS